METVNVLLEGHSWNYGHHQREGELEWADGQLSTAEVRLGSSLNLQNSVSSGM